LFDNLHRGEINWKHKKGKNDAIQELNRGQEEQRRGEEVGSRGEERGSESSTRTDLWPGRWPAGADTGAGKERSAGRGVPGQEGMEAPGGEGRPAGRSCGTHDR